MDAGSKARRTEATAKADQIRRQIAELQRQLDHETNSAASPHPEISRRVLAPKTPSPKKNASKASHHRRTVPKSDSRAIINHPPSFVEPAPHREPGPSNFLASLNSVRHEETESVDNALQRSVAFSDKPTSSVLGGTVKRDDQLAIIEELLLGPKEHISPPNDPEFKSLEPNSGIYLSERKLSHEDLQEALRARYYLSPSTVYSVARLLPSKQGYDIPVEGDWVTIAVVAERGPVKVTMSTGSGKAEPSETDNSKLSGKKFLTLKLVDFGSVNRSDSPSGKEIRGDAFLNMLLFEADSHSTEAVEGDKLGRFAKKIYKGGSGGAYEACASVQEGTVLAVLNPRILKPFKRNAGVEAGRPHPRDNILAITPTSAATVLVIGQARDLGFCSAIKRDGKTCNSWLDKRVCGDRNVCEWHFNAAVNARRNVRAEFSTSTSGLSSDGKRLKGSFRQSNNDGLLPANGRSGGADGEAVYMYSGSAIRSGPLDEAVGEKIGRGRQERLKRKRDALQAEEGLSKLATQRGGSDPIMRKVHTARDSMVKLHSKRKKSTSSTVHLEKLPASPPLPPSTNNSTYSTRLIKNMGFNPARATSGNESSRSDETKRKLEALQSASSCRIVELGSRPGKKIRSGLRIPSEIAADECGDGSDHQGSAPRDDGESDSDIEIANPNE